jgi:signal transduction histidine kinase
MLEFPRYEARARLGVWLRPLRNGPLTGVLVFAGTAMLALSLALLLAPVASNAAFSLFLGAVMLSAWCAGVRAGVATTLVGVVSLSYFFEGSAHSIAIESADTLVDLVVFGLVAWLISWLSANLRDARSRAEFARADANLARAVAEEAVGIRDGFLASVAHDLRSPLTAIKDQADLLRARLVRAHDPEREAWVYRLDAIGVTVDRMESAIDELLDVARLRAGAPLTIRTAPVDLALLVRKVIHAYRCQDPTTSIDLRLRGVPIIGVWDERRLERVLENLVGNALECLPEGGTVLVDVRRHENADGTVWALIRVSGSSGVPTPIEPGRLFAATVSDRAYGTGVGLVSARQIVAQHGGQLQVESAEGEGSLFSVRLPIDSTALTARASSS